MDENLYSIAESLSTMNENLHSMNESLPATNENLAAINQSLYFMKVQKNENKESPHYTLARFTVSAYEVVQLRQFYTGVVSTYAH